MAEISVELLDAKNTSKVLLLIEDAKRTDTVLSLKKKLANKSKLKTVFSIFVISEHLSVDRISLRQEPRGKSLRDEEILSNLSSTNASTQLYFKDLGPQIGWKTG